eukprot:TRINITY_DN15501_c0_g1_i1.p1 TRINITY_DN15501_c0_g1~~TRINITY_DN15501_c0_g1_i1.p1  ORF type:complete len:356 (-),score=110.77 TRINITY_DN15501_c0_g1_i1:5-1072(-)
MIRRPPRSTLSSSSAASDVYKRQVSTQSTGVDRASTMSVEDLEAQIAAQGDKVKSMKDSGADKAAIKEEVVQLLALKEQLPEGHALKPVPKGKKKAAPPAPAPKKEKKPAAKVEKKVAPAPVKQEKVAPKNESVVDCAQYFKEHGVEALFDTLAKELATAQPADPKAWMASKLGGAAPSGPKAPSEEDLITGYRSHSCGALRLSHVGQTVKLCGWVQASRDQKHFCFVDLRDRYGITQCVADNGEDPTMKALYEKATTLGREWVVQVTGVVRERSNKNMNRPTGAVELVPTAIEVLNESNTPPFKIEDKTDAGYDVRLQYRYLDLRRNPVREAMVLRNRVTMAVREILNLSLIHI